MIYFKNLLLITLVSMSSFIFAEDHQGCLISSGKSLIIDQSCECISTSTCAKFRAFKFNDSLFSINDKNGRNVFNSKEKSKMKESYSLYNQIMDLKANGKVNSPEIKALYVKLDKLNFEMRKSLLTNHNEMFIISKAVYKKNIEARKKRNEKNLKRIKEMLKSPENSIASNNEPNSNTKKNVIANETKPAPKLSTAEAVALQAKNNENETILRNLNINPNRFERSEDDSLFDIVTKSYKRSAYPKLLAP